MRLNFVLILLTLLAHSLSSANGNFVGNGGDAVSAEFTQHARLTFENLLKSNIPAELKLVVSDVSQKIETITVSTEKQLFLDDREVDAKNFPDQLLIQVSRSRWTSQQALNLKARTMLVIHEYVWVSGYDDSQYKLTNQLIAFVHFDQNSPQGYFASTPTVAAETYWEKGQLKIEYSFRSEIYYDKAITYECSLRLQPFAPCTSPVEAHIESGINLFKVRAVSVDKTNTPEALFDFKTDRSQSKNSVKDFLMMGEEAFSYRVVDDRVLQALCTVDDEAPRECWNIIQMSPFNPGSRKLEVLVKFKDGTQENLTYNW